MKRVLLIIILTVFTTNYTFASAQSCFTTPQEIDSYISSIVQVISNIPKWSFDWYMVWWDAWIRFQEWAPSVSRQLMEWTFVWAQVMTKISLNAVAWDMFTNMKIIFNSPAAIRDWKRLISLEEYITESSLKIAYSWVWNVALDESAKNSFKNIFEWIAIIDWTSWWDDWTITYWDVFWFTWKVHNFYKEVYLNLVWNNTNDRDLEEAAISLFQTDKIKISSINNSEYNNLKNQYALSTWAWNVCEDTFSKEFLDNIRMITQNSWMRWWDALERFANAWELLKEVLNDISWSQQLSKEYEARKAELLARHYWQELAEDLLSYKWTWWVWMLLDSLKENVVSPLISLSNKIEEISKTSEISDEVFSQERTDWIQQNQSNQITRESFAASMSNSFDLVLSMQQIDFADSTLQDPRPITQKIPDLSKIVYQWVLVVWARDKKDTIIYNLGMACQYQCVNHWDPFTDCWYD